MSTRQDVFGYLKKQPDASLQEVLEKISDAKESTVRRYFFEYQKSDKKAKKTVPEKTSSGKSKTTTKKKPAPKKRSKKPLKQQVYDFMETSPDATLKELSESFKGAQKTTIGNYRRLWLKERQQGGETISKSKRAEIFNYLNNNPTSNINDLKKVFPEVANKLITVFRSWKNSQKGMTESLNISDVKTAISKKGHDFKEKSQHWLEKQKETIAKQKDIIEKQQTRIEALKSQLPDVRRPKLVNLVKDFILKKVLNR